MGVQVPLLMRGPLVLAAFAPVWAMAAPWETWAQIKDFHETLELVLSWPVNMGYVHMDNGIELNDDVVQRVPFDGPFCGANRTYIDSKNYSLIMFSGNDVGHQRATYIIGNIPGKEKSEGGTVKLKYIPPQFLNGYKHFVALLEMSHYIPRFLPDHEPPYNCSLNRGTTLMADPGCHPDATIWPKCSPMRFVHDDTCIAWKNLPTHDTRNRFNLTLFAETNNLTAVDIKWYTLREPETKKGTSTSALLDLDTIASPSDDAEEPRVGRRTHDADGDMDVCSDRHHPTILTAT